MGNQIELFLLSDVPQNYLGLPEHFSLRKPRSFVRNRAPTDDDITVQQGYYQVGDFWVYDNGNFGEEEIWYLAEIGFDGVAGNKAKWTMLQSATPTDELYITPYIVDVNGNPGSAFTTIQSAIDQAVADGADLNNPRIIYIRLGTYVENLQIPAGIKLQSLGTNRSLGTHVMVMGNHTITEAALIAVQGIFFQDGANDGTILFDPDGNTVLYNFKDSVFFGSSTSGVFFDFAATGHIFNDCSFSHSAGMPIFSSSSGGIVNFRVCQFSEGFIDTPNTELHFFYCHGIPNIVAQDSLIAQYSTFNAEGSIAGTGNVILKQVGLGSPAITSTGILELSNIYKVALGNSGDLYSPGMDLRAVATTMGNVIPSKRVDDSYGIDGEMDFYIGVTDTSSPRVITLPDSPFACLDRTYIIKDESGGAGTNSIILDAPNLIDGQASLAIAVDYGSVEVIFDGTNYHVI